MMSYNGSCTMPSETSGVRRRSTRLGRLSSVRNFLFSSTIGRLFRLERRQSSCCTKTSEALDGTPKVDEVGEKLLASRGPTETLRKASEAKLANTPTSLAPVVASTVSAMSARVTDAFFAVSPSTSLKSPRVVLRALVPSDASQSRRMDLVLLQETPIWDELTRAAWNGCSFANRARVWRLLVGYEPLNFMSREPALLTKRARYRHYVRALYAPNGRVQFDWPFPLCIIEGNNPEVYDIVREEHNDEAVLKLTSTDVCSQQHVPQPGHQQRKEHQPKRLRSQRQKQHCNFQWSVSPTNGTEAPSKSPTSNQKAIIEYSSFSAKILRQIEMDLPRTHPHIPVFHIDEVRNPMRRILYVFGMLNPNNNYVQGMNEILSAILIVFLAEQTKKKDALTIDSLLRKTEFNRMFSDQQLADAEADAFWTFSAIISTVEDNFTPDQPGILRRVARLEEIVSCVDPVLAEHLAANGNDFLQFAFRWMNCLLMRELPFHLVVKLWDALLACADGIADFHVYFCAALLTRFTDNLLTLDFEQCMLFLQHLPTQAWTEDDIDELLSQAFIWKQSLPFDSLSP